MTPDGSILLLTRHGRTVLNSEGRLRGHLDPELDEVGHAEAAVLADAVADLVIARGCAGIVTSPLRRAVQTAETIAARIGAPVTAAPGLIDRDYGRWTGALVSEVIAQFGSLDRIDGVEAAASITGRALAVLEDQRSLVADGAVVMVAHDVVNRLLLAALEPGLGPWERIGQRTACWNLLAATGTGWQVLAVDRKGTDAAR